MKKAMVLTVSLVLVFGLVACGGSPGSDIPSASVPPAESSPIGSSEIESYVFGIALNALDENTSEGYDFFMEGVESFLDENENLEIEVILTNAEGRADKQMTDVEDLISKGCDVIRVDAADTTAGIAICDQVVDAGIPVLEVRGVKSDRITVSAQGYNSHAMGLMYAAELEKLLEADPELKLNIGYIHGNPAQSETMDRISGAEYLAETYPDRVQLLDVKYGNWAADQAMAITEDWLVSQPEMNVICAASDEMAVGAINVLRSAGVIDDFYVTSIDGNLSGREAVASGDMLVTIMMRQRYVQFKWVEIMLSLARGEELPQQISLGTDAMFPVTIDNIEEAEAIANFEAVPE